jgi:hypothetical protein
MMRSKIPGRAAHTVRAEAIAAAGDSTRAPSKRPTASSVNDTSASRNTASVERARRRSTFQAIAFPARWVANTTRRSGPSVGGGAGGHA